MASKRGTPQGGAGADDAPALDLADYLPYRLSVASNRTSALVSRSYQDRFDITLWEWRILAVLGNVEPKTAQKLVEATAMDKVTVSRAVRGLDEKGFVSRTRHKTDGRSTHIRLTAKGREIYETVAPVALTFEKILLEDMTPDEVAMLKSLLIRIQARAEALLSEGESRQ